MAKRILAFDFGASSGRAMIGEFDGEKMSVTEIHRFSNDTVIVHGRMHWDILRLFFEVKTAINKAVKAGKVDAIGIDTWGVDFGLIDKHGELIGNPVCYRDERTVGMPEEVFKIIPKHDLYRRTGNQTMRINTIYQLYYLAKYRPEIMERTEKILFTPDLMAYFLTGVMRAEETIASTSNILNPYTKQFDRELLRMLGIKDTILPEIIEPGTVYGTLTPALCEEFDCEPIPVIAVCTHDTASAVLSAPADKDFVYISCGTWSLFGTELPSPVITDASEKIDYTNEGGYGKTTRFLKNIMGLWLIQESRREWIRRGESVTFSDLEREALAAKPFLSFIDVDDRLFESAGDLPGRVLDYCKKTGQPVPENRGEIMRCIYQSLAMKYKYTFENLVRMTGVRYPHIHMLGGGIKDTLLCRMTAAATGATVLAGPTEATVMGNIAVQMIALGEIPSWQAAREVIGASTPLATYEPEDTAAWDEAFATYQRVIKK